MLKRLFRTKTFWAALAAIVTAGQQVATGGVGLTEGLQIALPALLALLLRDGVAKSEQASREALLPPQHTLVPSGSTAAEPGPPTPSLRVPGPAGPGELP